jgi:Na+/proline symporter
MLKFLKNLLIIFGLILLIAAVVLLVKNVYDITNITNVANANNSAMPWTNPRNLILIQVGGTLVAGFLLGLGIGMPKQTFKQRLEEKHASAPNETRAAGDNTAA